MCQPGSGPLPNLGVPTAMEGVLAFRDGTGSEVVALPSPGALVGCSRRVGTQEGRLGQQHPTLLLETVLREGHRVSELLGPRLQACAHSGSVCARVASCGSSAGKGLASSGLDLHPNPLRRKGQESPHL